MDIVTPPMKDLLAKVDSRYTLVVLASKRARQLVTGVEPRVRANTTKDVSRALAEVVSDKITFARTKYSIK